LSENKDREAITMMIGKAGAAQTAISTADANSITVRGKDLTGDLMGRLGFTAYFHLLLTGKEPTSDQLYFLDVLLVAIAEHGLVPTNQVARMTLAADPDALQGAVAAGILGCGSVVLGTAEACAEFLVAAKGAIGDGDTDAGMQKFVAALKASGKKVPGFGHPLHKPLDPRAERIFALAEERGIAGTYTRLARQSAGAVAEVYGKPLTLNVSMAIAAILLDLGFPKRIVKAIPILARTASLLAHLAEEQEQPIGFLMAHHAEAAISYAGARDDET
jgi:citrate synthase